MFSLFVGLLTLDLILPLLLRCALMYFMYSVILNDTILGSTLLCYTVLCYTVFYTVLFYTLNQDVCVVPTLPKIGVLLFQGQNESISDIFKCIQLFKQYPALCGMVIPDTCTCVSGTHVHLFSNKAFCL